MLYTQPKSQKAKYLCKKRNLWEIFESNHGWGRTLFSCWCCQLSLNIFAYLATFSWKKTQDDPHLARRFCPLPQIYHLSTPAKTFRIRSPYCVINIRYIGWKVCTRKETKISSKKKWKFSIFIYIRWHQTNFWFVPQKMIAGSSYILSLWIRWSD